MKYACTNCLCEIDRPGLCQVCKMLDMAGNEVNKGAEDPHLELCPWCDGECEFVCHGGKNFPTYRARCKDRLCEGHGGWRHGSKELAAKHWNTRPGGRDGS